MFMMHLFYLLYIYLRIINYKLLKTMVLIPAYMRFINYNLQYNIFKNLIVQS